MRHTVASKCEQNTMYLLSTNAVNNFLSQSIIVQLWCDQIKNALKEHPPKCSPTIKLST